MKHIAHGMAAADRSLISAPIICEAIARPKDHGRNEKMTSEVPQMMMAAMRSIWKRLNSVSTMGTVTRYAAVMLVVSDTMSEMTAVRMRITGTLILVPTMSSNLSMMVSNMPQSVTTWK